MSIDFSQLNYKKLLLVIGFIAMCLILAFGIYWMFFKPDVPGPGEPGYVPPGAKLPETGEGFEAEELGPGGQLPGTGDMPGAEREQIEFEGTQVKNPIPDQIARGSDTYALPLTENKVSGVTLSSNKQGVNFYDKETERFYRITADGEKLALSDEKFYQVKDVAWSDDATEAIITYPDDIKVFYDFSSREKTTLPKELKEPVFSKDNEQISFKFITSNEDQNFLAVSSPNGTGAQFVEPLGSESNKVQTTFSPSKEVVALYEKPTGLNSSEVFLIGQRGENFKSLQINGTHARGIWSPSGNKLLYHSVLAENNFNPNLWIVDANGDAIGQHQFDLNLSTWVEKCVFTTETEIYCAVPKNLPDGAGLYEEALKNTTDEIYKIDLATGAKQKIANPVLSQGKGEFRIGSLQISGDGRFLFFLDEITEQVYSVQLK